VSRAFRLRQGWWQQEVPWLATFLVATLLVTEIPFSLAYGQAARGVVFRGLFWVPYDMPQYLAAMREGAASTSWLIHDHLTAEAHRPVLMYIPYVAMGKFAGLFHWSIPIVFHCAQILARITTLTTIYLFGGSVLRTVRQRRLALALIICGSGLFLGAGIVGISPFMGEEVNTFALLFAAPHLMLGFCALVFALRWYLDSWTRPRRRLIPLCAGAVVGIALDNSFSLVTLAAVIGVHLVVMWLAHRHVPPIALACASAMAIVAGPFVLYSVLTFRLDPFWGVVYGRQNVTLTPSPFVLALSVAPLLALAVFGLPAWIQHLTPGRLLLLVWIVTTACLMYLPVGVQYRFGTGLTVPLGVMATVGFDRCWKGLRSRYRHARPAVQMCLLIAATTCSAAVFFSPAIVFAFTVSAATHPASDMGDSTMFEPAAVVQAAHWLATIQGADDIVLALPLTGNELAADIRGRVYVGHGMATFDFSAKQRAAETFYRATGNRQDRAAFLVANHIRYVFYGPEERRLSGPDPFAGLPLRVVYQSSEVTIFQLEN